jgi:hypothetical protein
MGEAKLHPSTSECSSCEKEHQKSTKRNHAFGPSVGICSEPLPPPLFLLINTESMAIFFTSLFVFLLSVLKRKLISKRDRKVGLANSGEEILNVRFSQFFQ